MAINEDKALEILHELIQKPETKAADVPHIWAELMAIYEQQFAPPVVEQKKKRRRRVASNTSVGWPAGVGRAEYANWKATQQAKGVTEGLNPQAYKLAKESRGPEAKPASPVALAKKATATMGAKRGRKPAK